MKKLIILAFSFAGLAYASPTPTITATATVSPHPSPSPSASVTAGCSQEITCQSGSELGAKKSCSSDKAGGECQTIDNGTNLYGVKCRDKSTDDWTS